MSLDAPPEAENLRLWVAEAEHRLQELRAGKAKEIPARDVFRRAKRILADGHQRRRPGYWRYRMP